MPMETRQDGGFSARLPPKVSFQSMPNHDYRFLPEFAHPYNKLAPHCDIVVASPAGGEAPLDEGSVKMFENDKESQEFLKTKSHLWKNTEKLESFVGKEREFDAIFYVGGHGRKCLCINERRSSYC